jgi:hypothetical protein
MRIAASIVRWQAAFATKAYQTSSPIFWQHVFDSYAHDELVWRLKLVFELVCRRKAPVEVEGGALPELSPSPSYFALHHLNPGSHRRGAPQPRSGASWVVRAYCSPHLDGGDGISPYFHLLSPSPPNKGSGSILPGGRPPVNVLRKGGRSPNGPT